MKRAISLILVAIMALMLVPAFSVAAAGTDKADAVVYLNGSAGADSNDGKTAATAVATLIKAVDVANTYVDAKKVVIVVTGDTSFADNVNYILPENKAPIVITSYYDGKDYRTEGAQLTTFNAAVAVLYLNGTYTLEYVRLNCIRDNFIISMQYNSFTVGAEVEVIPLESRAAVMSAYPILLVGVNTSGGVGYDKAQTPTTFTNDINVEVNSGTWQYIRGGDRDSLSTYDGNMTININGGKFLSPISDSDAVGYQKSGNTNGPTGKSSYGENAKIVMNLNGGEMKNLIGSCYVGTGTGHASAADITINIHDGFKLINKFCAVQLTNALFDGNLVINIYGGDLSEVLETMLTNQSVANGGTGTVTVNHDPNNANSVKAFNALKDACVDDTDVKYGEIKVEVVTDAPVTDAPVVTTAAPVVTDAPVDTTVAPAEPEDTPATGDAYVMAVFAAAAVLCIGAVVIIKKREN